MEVNIREAQPDDYAVIGELVRNVLGYPDVDDEKLIVRLEKMRADSKYLTIVAELDGEVVGFTGIFRGIAYNVNGEYIQITALAVRKDMQNKKIGTQLTQWVEAYAVRNNIQRIVLTSRTHRVEAHAFYESHGYIKKSYGFYKDVL